MADKARPASGAAFTPQADCGRRSVCALPATHPDVCNYMQRCMILISKGETSWELKAITHIHLPEDI